MGLYAAGDGSAARNGSCEAGMGAGVVRTNGLNDGADWTGWGGKRETVLDVGWTGWDGAHEAG